LVEKVVETAAMPHLENLAVGEVVPVRFHNHVITLKIGRYSTKHAGNFEREILYSSSVVGAIHGVPSIFPDGASIGVALQFDLVRSDRIVCQYPETSNGESARDECERRHLKIVHRPVSPPVRWIRYQRGEL